MSSDDLNKMVPPVPSGQRPLSTNGAMARRRRNRVLLLTALSLLLAVLAYSTYYYAQNRRAPTIRFTTATAKVEPLQYLYSFSGADATAMNQPTGVAIIGNRCYVTDYAYRTVRVYTLAGTHLFDFGAIKDGKNTKMSSPVHLAVGPDNTIWITDRVLKQLYVFDQDGKFIKTFHPNNDASYKWSPLALAFDKAGDLYVTDVGDSEKHQVLVMGPDGKVKAQWGSSQQVVMSTDAPGKFYFPNGIAVSGTGKDAIVYVADGDNRRVQEFSTTGTFIRIVNTSGTPRGMTLDKQGRLFVVDALAHRIDMYDSKGDMLTTFGENGTGPGQFSFPNDITFDARGRAFVTDRNNDQVQVWGPLVAEIPGITRVTPGTAWVPFLLAALAALAALLASRRRRRFVVMPDFVESMVAAGTVAAMDRKRFRWADTHDGHAAYDGRVVDDVDLGALISGEPHSDSEARAIQAKLGVTMEQAQVLALAKWARTLCTQDVELARYAVRLGVDVYDRDTWLKRFGSKTK